MAKSPSRSSVKLIIGEAPWLNRAAQSWHQLQPEVKIIPVVLTQDNSYAFDFSSLAEHNPKKSSAFVAWSDQFLNLRRYEIYLHVRKMCFALPPLVHPLAKIDPNTLIPDHSWVDQGAQIGAGVKLGINCCVGFGASVEDGTRIGENVMIGEHAIIGSGCRIDSFVTLGAHVHLKAGTKLGAFSRLTKAGVYAGSYAEGTFIEDNFSAQIIS